MTDLDDRSGRGGELIPFPIRLPTSPPRWGDDGEAGGAGGTELVTRPPHVVSEDRVLDAELVDDDPPTTTVVKRVIQPVTLVVNAVCHHQPTVTTSKWLARQLVYVFTGFGVVAKKWWDRHSGALYQRQMIAAEAAGDQEGLKDWELRAARHAAHSHRRRMALLEMPIRLTKALLVATVLGLVVLVLGGLAYGVASEDIRVVFDPLVGTVTAVGWLVAALVWLVWWLAILAPALVVGGLWQVGRNTRLGPTWLRAPEKPGDQMDKLPDEGTIVKAIHNLNIKGFNDAIKGGWRIQFLMPPVIDGRGWRTQIALPPACTVEDIVRRKPVLAHNLVRYPIEVWPTEPKPAVLDLWVAKSGALSGPVDPWPLLKDLDNARTDYFKGVPVGVTIKGDVINGRLFEANWVAGGMMGSGKSTLVITTLLGAMLDPLVDIDVVVMADNADYDPMKPRLNRLVTGAGDDTVAQCMEMLYEQFEDLSVRGEALREHDERAVTRDIAEKDPRLRPRIVVIDECQNLFIGEHGKDAIELTTKVMSTARKYAITLMFLTPEPSKDACPRKLISIASNKACYAIGDHQGNDAVLGSGSYKSGISAVGLTPKTDEGPGDVGTCMQRGFTAKPGLMRGFYPTQNDAHRVTQRALQLRGTQHKRLTAAPEPEVRDLLADVAEVLGRDPVRAADVPALLTTAFPRHAPYQRMTGKELAARLAAEGVKVPATGNVWPVYPERVREALRTRGA